MFLNHLGTGFVLGRILQVLSELVIRTVLRDQADCFTTLLAYHTWVDTRLAALVQKPLERAVEA